MIQRRATLAAILLLALALRLYHLGQPIRYDEAWTYLHFASKPLAVALSDYSLPNNHLFHTLLVWLCTRVFGNAAWAIRLPVLVAGLGVVAAVYPVARRLDRPEAGVFAAVLAAASPILVLYSTNARGYMLICLAFLVMLLLAVAILAEETTGRWMLFAIVAALGVYTVPVMFYPIGALGLWIVVERLRRGGTRALAGSLPRILAALAVGGALTLAFYAPVLLAHSDSGVASNRFVTPLPVGGLIAALPAFLRSLEATLALGMSRPAIVAVMLLSVVGLLRRDPLRPARVTLALSAVGTCALLLVITRRPPPARAWLFLVPLACVYAGIGLAALAEWTASVLRVRQQILVPAGAFLLLLLTGAYTIVGRVVLDSDETDWLGLKDAPDVARYLLAEFREGDRLVLVATGPPLDYYLQTLGGRTLGTMTAAAGTSRLLVLVNTGHEQTVAGILERHPEARYDPMAQPRPLRAFRTSSILTVHPLTP